MTTVLISSFKQALPDAHIIRRVTLIDGLTGEMAEAQGVASIRALYRRANAELRLIAKGHSYVNSFVIAGVSKTWMQLDSNNVNRKILMETYNL